MISNNASSSTAQAYICSKLGINSNEAYEDYIAKKDNFFFIPVILTEFLDF
jgi:hypothetical protein